MYVSVIHIWPTTENFILLNVQATLGNKMAEGTEQELRNVHEEEEKGIPELSMLPIIIARWSANAQPALLMSPPSSSLT